MVVAILGFILGTILTIWLMVWLFVKAWEGFGRAYRTLKPARNRTGKKEHADGYGKDKYDHLEFKILKDN